MIDWILFLPFLWLWIAFSGCYCCLQVSSIVLDYFQKRKFEREAVAEVERTWKTFYEYIEKENPKSVYLPYTGWYVERRNTHWTRREAL